MKQMKYYLMAAALLAASSGFVSCNSDEDNVTNPVADFAASNKKHDTAILLCTFGSTFEESVKTYDAIEKDFKEKYGNEADIYLSFTSRTCVNRVYEATGIDRVQPDYWLEALGEAGYEKVAVQSLHVIPGEEYASLMGTDVKKKFMIERYPHIKVLKSPNLLDDENDVEAVASYLFEDYKTDLSNKKNIVLFMGHGNPDGVYQHANDMYTAVEEALQTKAANKNVFVGTVDYGEMLFCPEDWKSATMNVDDMADTYIYKKLVDYVKQNGGDYSDYTVYLVPFMSIAGDHAHNDMWGIDDKTEVKDALPEADCCWRLKIQKMGFNINTTEESHNGSVDKCTIKGLADRANIRAIWLKHLTDRWNDADEWTTGEDYQ